MSVGSCVVQGMWCLLACKDNTCIPQGRCPPMPAWKCTVLCFEDHMCHPSQAGGIPRCCGSLWTSVAGSDCLVWLFDAWQLYVCALPAVVA